MRICSLTLLAALAAIVAVAGCTSTSEGSPRAVPGHTADDSGASTPPPTETADLPYAGAPAVKSPMDSERFQQDPCQALTADQADVLNVETPGKLRDGGLGNACEFRGLSDRRALVEIASLDKNPYGVSALYQAEQDGKLAFLTPLEPIEGYPAVAYGAPDERETGGCSVVIGASDEIAFEIVLQLSTDKVGKKEPCETAAMVAGMVVETMKAAQ
ncbi:MAG: DUF3558 domain-containing protein [Actinophytocola sp.]|uniref:DUF3558 domain-containing protein n=1 Tax=Actinophytocola sp. TaxID=1872138 RepID=UPI003C74749A